MSARIVLPVIAVGWPVQTCQKFGPLVLLNLFGVGSRSAPIGALERTKFVLLYQCVRAVRRRGPTSGPIHMLMASGDHGVVPTARTIELFRSGMTPAIPANSDAENGHR